MLSFMYCVSPRGCVLSSHMLLLTCQGRWMIFWAAEYLLDLLDLGLACWRFCMSVQFALHL